MYGVKCRDKCALKGEDYYWCEVYGRSHYNYWDFCSPDPSTTINQERCRDACEARGKSYYWCHTGSNWDYCSPAFTVGMLGFESVTAGGHSMDWDYSSLYFTFIYLNIAVVGID